MKLTKVGNIRISVRRIKTDNDGRAVLYPTPNKNQNIKTVKDQVANRIEDVNRLYNVFFQSDIPYELEKLFEGLVNQVNEAGKAKKEEVLRKFRGTEYQSRERKIHVQVERFSYSPSGKFVKHAMELFVRERLSDKWQSEKNRKVAVEVLCCLCAGKKYKANVSKLDGTLVKDFISACAMIRPKDHIFVYNTRDIETAFTALLKETVKKCEIDLYTSVDQHGKDEEIRKNICAQINYMKSISKYSYKFKGTDVVKEIKDLRYQAATDDRMDAIIVRMRKTLKRGDNKEVAIRLLQGLAQMNGESWDSVIEEMMEDEQEKNRLINFIYAVNHDYYRMNIIRSVKNLNVKVQSRKQKEDGQEQTTILGLSCAENPKKKALYDTLLNYAKSSKNADQTLIDLKKLLFQYFLGEYDDSDYYTYFSEKNLWKFPCNTKGYFDTYFKSTGEEKPEAKDILDELMRGKKNAKKIKGRIRYVNYGFYKHMIEVYKENAFSLYWIHFIRDYIDQNYIRKSKCFAERDLYIDTMMKKCWDGMIRYLCEKYIDLGKAVYHFAMPEQMKPVGEAKYGIVTDKYENGISSFDYEEIKAEENLQRDIADATVAAVSNFARSVLDYTNNLNGKEDILMFSDDDISKFMAKDAVKKVLRYFGGMSNCPDFGKAENEKQDQKMVREIRDILRAVRNENFHYATEKKGDFTYELVEKLFQNDMQAYAKIIRDKYYTNNAALFYGTENIKEMMKRFYETYQIREAQIPAFHTIFQRKKLPEYLNTLLGDSGLNMDSDKRNIFDGAVYFLLKEIYYQDFCINGRGAATCFFDAVDDYYGKQKGCVIDKGNEKRYFIDKKVNKKDYPYFESAKSFIMYIDFLRSQDQNMSLGSICQAILTEYNQQNSKQDKQEIIYKNFKMLLEICMRDAFLNYVKMKKQYDFIKKPKMKDVSVLSDKMLQEYLDNTPISCFDFLKPENIENQENMDDIKRTRYMWYVFAHFTSPRQLNFLIGDFKNYIQFRKDIINRAFYAKEIDDNGKIEWSKKIFNKIRNTEEILQVLEFVRGISGRISNQFKDYYGDEEEYAKYLHHYIDFEVIENSDQPVFHSFQSFCNSTLPDGMRMDIYADEINPKILRNVELSRMYGGGDVYLGGHEKITADEIKEFYDNKNEVQRILQKGLCDTVEEQEFIKKQQELKERITLHDITKIWNIVDDLHAQLVSMSYLRERDEMYLLLGFYYLALQNPEGWKEENLETFGGEGKEINIRSGKVLYLIVSIFTYGLDYLYEKDGKIEKRGGEISGKIGKFDKEYKNSLNCVIRLFENEKQDRDNNNIRNYVDHFKYYSLHDKSILDLYNAYYTYLFTYSSKLQRSIWANFQSILEKEHIHAEMRVIKGDKTYVTEIDDTKYFSEKFTFKLSDKASVPSVKIDAREGRFLAELKAVLSYKIE